MHILEGNTPFLFPRPLMEKFGLVVDYGRKRLQWSDSHGHESDKGASKVTTSWTWLTIQSHCAVDCADRISSTSPR